MTHRTHHSGHSHWEQKPSENLSQYVIHQFLNVHVVHKWTFWDHLLECGWDPLLNHRKLWGSFQPQLSTTKIFVSKDQQYQNSLAIDSCWSCMCWPRFRNFLAQWVTGWTQTPQKDFTSCSCPYSQSQTYGASSQASSSGANCHSIPLLQNNHFLECLMKWSTTKNMDVLNGLSKSPRSKAHSTYIPSQLKRTPMQTDLWAAASVAWPRF